MDPVAGKVIGSLKTSTNKIHSGHVESGTRNCHLELDFNPFSMGQSERFEWVDCMLMAAFGLTS